MKLYPAGVHCLHGCCPQALCLLQIGFSHLLNVWKFTNRKICKFQVKIWLHGAYPSSRPRGGGARRGGGWGEAGLWAHRWPSGGSRGGSPLPLASFTSLHRSWSTPVSDTQLHLFPDLYRLEDSGTLSRCPLNLLQSFPASASPSLYPFHVRLPSFLPPSLHLFLIFLLSSRPLSLPSFPPCF